MWWWYSTGRCPGGADPTFVLTYYSTNYCEWIPVFFAENVSPVYCVEARRRRSHMGLSSPFIFILRILDDTSCLAVCAVSHLYWAVNCDVLRRLVIHAQLESTRTWCSVILYFLSTSPFRLSLSLPVPIQQSSWSVTDYPCSTWTAAMKCNYTTVSTALWQH